MPSSSWAQWPGIGSRRQSVKRHRLQHSVVYWKHICLRLLTQAVDYVHGGVRSLGRYINTHFKFKIKLYIYIYILATREYLSRYATNFLFNSFFFRIFHCLQWHFSSFFLSPFVTKSFWISLLIDSQIAVSYFFFCFLLFLFLLNSVYRIPWCW